MERLFNLCTKFVSKNIKIFRNEETIRFLPDHIKCKIILYLNRLYDGISDFVLLEILLNKQLKQLDLTQIEILDETLDCIAVNSPNLISIDMHNVIYSFSREVVSKFFNKVATFEEITIKDCDILDDELLFNITQYCNKLDLLDVAGCKKLTDECIEALNDLKLTRLNMSGTNITDDFLGRLSRSPLNNYLVEINVSNTNISSTGLALLRWDKLKYIGFQNCDMKNNLEFIGTNNNLKYIEWTISAN